MASDRARISHDPSRAYRAVVAQQGRVTLEADVNEAGLIESEARRLETIDIIGPAGTPTVPPPGDGYKATPGATLEDTVISSGLYYLGGWRLSLDQPVTVNAQPDWLNRLPPSSPPAGNTLVSLLVTEQSVCAVEDTALREVALGGPDTAARLRLMQHFLQLSLAGSTCEDGSSAVAKLLAADGVGLDPYSYQLISGATLQVGFVTDSPTSDPCSPVAAGGYLGADNQLIRVTVASFKPKPKTGQILWGWNNASLLYRATLTDKTAGVFTLSGAPLDQEHAPQLGQAVEILRAEADLKNGDFIAADAGFVTTVTAAYSFDTGTLTVDNIAGLPADYVNDPNPLFIRLWQAIVPFTAGQAAPLDSVSGLTVTVNLTALPTQIAARPFWRFAARPDTPTQIYPRRYMDSPQAPDGPRQWLCDLAVIGPVGGALGLLADCRPTFIPLTDQSPGGCCGLTLDSAGVDAMGGLQAVVDSLTNGPAVLSLKPGTYTLPSALVLTAAHQGLTIEGCAAGVFIAPDSAQLAGFALGLIILDAVDEVTIRGLDFNVPLVPPASGAQGGTLVGVLAVNTTGTVVEGCGFSLSATAPGAFGGGITLIGEALNLSVRRCRFTGEAVNDAAQVCGVLAAVNTANVRTLLSDVDIVDNLFQTLNTGVFVYARLGEVRCADNRVRDCVTGLLFADAVLGGAAGFAKQSVGAGQTNAGQVNAGLSRAVLAGFVAPALALSAQSNAPFFARGAGEAAKVSKVADSVLRADIATRGDAIYTEIAHHAAKLGAQSASRPAASRPAATGADYAAAIDQVDTVSVGAEANDYRSVVSAALHVQDNDITLVSVGAQATPGVGIVVIMSPKDESGMVQANGNRVVCQDSRTCALSVLFPDFLTVSANLLVQPAANQSTPHTPALIVFTQGSARSEIAGNVVRSGAYILPPRTAPSPSADWSFFNTVA